jgi:hypothetical protein
VTSTTLRIARLDGGTLVLEALSLARAFFVTAGFEEFDRSAAATDRNRIVMADVGLLNRVMRARTAHTNWDPFVGAPLPFLVAIPHDLDLIASSDAPGRRPRGDASSETPSNRWSEVDGVSGALTARVRLRRWPIGHEFLEAPTDAAVVGAELLRTERFLFEVPE